MKRFQTHYDNLKVVRNAPDEVIRAAYKSLIQKYHPDRNSDNAEATRIMKILNESFAVLSDPVRRRNHDQWIDSIERVYFEERVRSNVKPVPRTQSTSPHQQPSTVHKRPSTVRKQSTPTHKQSNTTETQSSPTESGNFSYIAGVTFAVLIALLFIGNYFSDEDSHSPPEPEVSTASAPLDDSPPESDSAPLPPILMRRAPAYVRPAFAPNGEPWPTQAGYVSGYDRLLRNGYSTVTVDNLQNDSDVFVKLYSLNGKGSYPARVFFIPANGTFSIRKVNAGSYDIRYRDLNDGGLSRSEQFILKEIRTPEGIEFSDMTMTLYKVRNGNMHTYQLSESEF